jgi:hypothetical protein
VAGAPVLGRPVHDAEVLRVRGGPLGDRELGAPCGEGADWGGVFNGDSGEFAA